MPEINQDHLNEVTAEHAKYLDEKESKKKADEQAKHEAQIKQAEAVKKLPAFQAVTVKQPKKEKSKLEIASYKFLIQSLWLLGLVGFSCLFFSLVVTATYWNFFKADPIQTTIGLNLIIYSTSTDDFKWYIDLLAVASYSLFFFLVFTFKTLSTKRDETDIIVLIFLSVPASAICGSLVWLTLKIQIYG